MADLAWTLKIDWDGDGTYTDESDRLYNLTVQRGRQFYIKSDGSGFERMRPGSMTAYLRNLDGRYDPYNTASPLYPDVGPGPYFILDVTDGTTTWHVMAGRLTDIRPTGDSTVSNVQVVGEDGWGFLSKTTPTVNIQSSIKADAAIQLILTDVDWPSTRWSTDLAVGADTHDYWWTDGDSALEAIHALMDAEFGFAFIRGDGMLVTRTRYAQTASSGTITDAERRPDILVSQPWDVVRNHVTVYAYGWKQYTDVVLWQAENVVNVGAGQTLTIWGDLQYNQQETVAQSIITPVATTDYTANTAEDGSGTDMTSDVSIAATAFTKRAKIEITNSGAMTAYMTLLQVRGTALVQNERSAATMEDSSSISAYSRRDLAVDVEWLQDFETARDMASYLRSLLARPAAFVEVQLRDEPAFQFVEIGDRVHLTLDTYHIDDDFRVARIIHEWLDTRGSVVNTRLLLEPEVEIDQTFWTFPATFGDTTVFGW